MKLRRYYVYIMASLSGTLYVGVTNNVQQRSWDHKAGEGSIFAKRYGVNRLVYFEVFQYVYGARLMEGGISRCARNGQLKKATARSFAQQRQQRFAQDDSFGTICEGRDSSLRSE